MNDPNNIYYTLSQRGAQQLTNKAQNTLACFLQSLYRPDGGFAGRDRQKSDGYYTYFAIATLASLQCNYDAQRVAQFLENTIQTTSLDIVHQIAIGRCYHLLGMNQQSSVIFQQLQPFFYSTLYETFLMALYSQDMNIIFPAPSSSPTAFLEQFRSGDGFANSPDMPLATTTTTAAALVLAHHWNMPRPEACLYWLMQQYHPLGGFRISPLVTYADPLSTTAALYALYCWQVSLPLAWRETCQDFLMEHWQTNGGFAETPDEAADSEYCFYTLLSLGCLA